MRNKSWGEERMSILDRIIEYWRFAKIKKAVKTGDRLLDLGCGHDSKLLIHFKDKIIEGVGIDLSVGKSKHSNVKLIRARVDQKINLNSNSFDKITALAVIEHVEHPEIMLKESYRLLKKTGVLLLTTPSKYSKPLLEFLALSLNIISKEEILDHKRYYDRKSLKKALKDSGFKESKINVKYFQFGFNLIALARK